MMTTASPLNSLDFPLFGNRLIEASAGTGKTYTIAALYVRLILGHPADSAASARDLLPADILVVTFTDAATKELRERIRERLSQAARFFRQQPVSTDAFLVEIRADYEESAWSTCARRLELAANWMDEAAVYTIHSWCNRMLQQHAFNSGSLFRQEVNTDDTALLNEVVRDYWRSFYYDIAADEPDFPALYGLFKQPDDLLKDIRGLLKDTDPIAACVAENQAITTVMATVNTCKQHTLQALKHPWQQWADEMKVLLDVAVKDKVLPAKNYNVANRQNWIDKIKAWCADPTQDTLALATGFNNLSAAGMAQLTHAGKTPPSHPCFEAIGALPEQLAALPSLKVELMKHAIHWIRTRYDSEKQRLARMTFDDMLTRLDHALQADQGQCLAQVIRQQYPIALIDEFQDTDPVQYRIFATLYPDDASGESGCFMIGDPKQAIYSFRGADIYTYLKAHQATAGRHYTLATNYRSTQALVAAVNQVFQQADQQQHGTFRFKHGDNNPLPFIPVAAQGRDDDWVIKAQPSPALTVWHWQTEAAVGLPAYRETMAAVTASEIVSLLNGAQLGHTGFQSSEGIRPLQASDIAILVRTGTEAKAMRDALSCRQLRSVYLSERDSIFASPEAVDLLLWLKAFADPRNERKVRTALSTATLGSSYQALHQLAVDEPAWERELERFLGYQLCWQDSGILPALRQLIHDYDLHTRLTNAGDGERGLTNILHLAELLQHASSHLEGEQALIRYLAEAIDTKGGGAGDENIIRLESDANLIKIVTIHKSKGLEYPLVFLPFVCSFREVGGRFDSHYRYHDAQQDLVIDLTKADASQALSDTERLQEDLRLLYVAMTRARYACWLGIAPVKSGNAKQCQLEKSAMGSLLAWQGGMAVGALAGQLSQLKGDCSSLTISPLPAAGSETYRAPQRADVTEPARLATSKITNNWWIASYSALQHDESSMLSSTQTQALQEPETAQDDKQNDEAQASHNTAPVPLIGVHGLARGAGAGVLIHGLLEQCAYLGFAAVQANPTLAHELIEQRFTASEWATQHDTLAAALGDWLAMSLLDNSRLSLAALKVDSYQAELEFLIGAEAVDTLALDRLVTQHTFGGQARPSVLPRYVNGLLKGFIDLVFVHNQRYYLIDYKFNSLGNDASDYTAAALEAAMLEKRYDLQCALYLLALHRLLKSRLGESYDYDTHMGGGLYLFLRGSQAATGGRVFNKPSRELIESMDRLFSTPRRKGAQ